MSLHVVVEGDTDEPVARKVAMLAGWNADSIFVEPTRGKSILDKNLARYNAAARWSPQFILRDLDNDSPCAGEMRAKLLVQPAPFMSFRFAVRSIEAWLMADPDKLAPFLRIPPAQIPAQPDGVIDPKETFVNLARLSTKPSIRRDIVPEHGKSRRTGGGYAACINDYSANHWRPEIARTNSPSLHRAIVALERLHDSWSDGTH